LNWVYITWPHSRLYFVLTCCYIVIFCGLGVQRTFPGANSHPSRYP
jgi:hypothetical protein